MAERSRIAGCYARVSTADQDATGQIDELRRYCQDRGLDVDRIRGPGGERRPGAPARAYVTARAAQGWGAVVRSDRRVWRSSRHSSRVATGARSPVGSRHTSGPSDDDAFASSVPLLSSVGKKVDTSGRLDASDSRSHTFPIASATRSLHHPRAAPVSSSRRQKGDGSAEHSRLPRV